MSSQHLLCVTGTAAAAEQNSTFLAGALLPTLPFIVADDGSIQRD